MRDAMALRLYDYASSGNCYKVRLLLSHLGLPYERVPVDIFAGDTMSEEHAARNLALTTPVLELEPGRYLPESAAILLHLAEGTDLLPDNRDERALVYRWLFFEQSAVLPTIRPTGVNHHMNWETLTHGGMGAVGLPAVKK